MIKQFFLLLITTVFSNCCFPQSDADSVINFYFGTNSSVLDSQQYEKIKLLKDAYPAITKIKGYTDTTGESFTNITLSKKRAFAVFNLLKADNFLPDSAIVEFHGESEEFPALGDNRRVSVHARKHSAQVSKEILMHSIPDTIQVINLDNIYFLPDRAILSPESIPYIQDLERKLKLYPTGIFEIVGHINYQSRLDSTHLKDLFELSKLRAKTVFDYLVEFGVAPERMTFKGVGNSQPLIASPRTVEEKRKNMRVQIIVLKQ